MSGQASHIRARESDLKESVMSKRTAGFTLIELLVVIAIIGALAAMASPMIRNARMKGKVTTTSSRIQEVSLAIDSFEGQWGDFPPSSFEDYFETSGNRVDSGIESVVLCLATRKKGGPFVTWKEDWLENLDGDSLASDEAMEKLDWYFVDNQLWECVDDFGSPLIYIQNKDYDDSFQVTHTEDGVQGTATGARSEKTKVYHSLTTYQLWSSGPDQKNENGDGDDIGSWK